MKNMPNVTSAMPISGQSTGTVKLRGPGLCHPAKTHSERLSTTSWSVEWSWFRGFGVLWWMIYRPSYTRYVLRWLSLFIP
jgi:hypothetical protein